MKLSFVSDMPVRAAGEKKASNISGMCVLQDGSVVLADCANYSLKHLSQSYQLMNVLKLSAWPWNVCDTNNNREVAVTLSNAKKIQFVRVDTKMALTQSIQTENECRGMCCSDGELFVCVKGNPFPKVIVYSVTTKHNLRTIQYEPSGQPLFVEIRYITASLDGNRLYATDGKLMKTIDRCGRLLAKCNDPAMDSAMGICAMGDGSVLATGFESNNVVRFSGEGTGSIGVVVNENGGIRKPWTVCCDYRRNDVLISCAEVDFIKHFKLVA